MRNSETNMDPNVVGPEIYTFKNIHIHNVKYKMSHKAYASERPCGLSFISIFFNTLNNSKMRVLLSPTH